MANRDDMVLTPTLEEEKAAAPTLAREGRTVAGRRKGKRRLVRRAAIAHAARRRVSKVARAARTARAGGGLGAGRFALGAGVLGLAAVAAAIVWRLQSDRSFKGAGHDIAKALLGDLDERAIAREMVLDRLRSSPELMYHIGRHGVTPEVRQLGASLEKLYYPQVKGAAMFDEDPYFDVNGSLDMLILRAKEAVISLTKDARGK